MSNKKMKNSISEVIENSEDRLITTFLPCGYQLGLTESPIDGEYQEAQFQSSWDWLIPVTRKIQETIKNKLNGTDYKTNEHLHQILNPCFYDKDSIYKSSVEFIKWYNSIYLK